MKKTLLLFTALIFFISIKVFAQPQSPILVEPPKEVDAAVLPLSLDWNDVDGASCYRVELTTDTVNGPVFEESCNAPQSHMEFPSGSLTLNTKYYWRVFACSPEGWSQSSGYWNFRTQAPSVEGTIENVKDGVIDLIADEKVSSAQGNILISRLNKAEQKISQDHPLLALIDMAIFKARVIILSFSNQINSETAGILNYNADGVIDLIAEELHRPVNQPKAEDYLVPASFELKQNYPNPFNPSTTIEYSIPKVANVTLKIFDVLGKEVATLVNESKSAGTYIINWNASNYSSGLYFYRINAGSFTETKKMFLVK